MNNVKIRKVQAGDEKVLAYIQTKSWKAAFCDILSAEMLKKCTEITGNEEMYQNVIENNLANGSILTVDEIPHCIAFWGRCRDVKYSECAELICIHSLRDKWNKGFGTRMMQHILAEIKDAGYKKVVLWVFEQNIRARNFYEKQGFAATEHYKNFFGAAEVLYEKTL